MRVEQTRNCCTSQLLYEFYKDKYCEPIHEEYTKRYLEHYINNAYAEEQKILYAFLTDEQKKSIKILKQFGFKRAGNKTTRPDRHKTKLYLYYLILD